MDGYNIKEVHYRDLVGRLIWKDNVIFRSLWGVGNEIVYDHKTYIVRHTAIADDVQHVNIEAKQEDSKQEDSEKEKTWKDIEDDFFEDGYR